MKEEKGLGNRPFSFNQGVSNSRGAGLLHLSGFLGGTGHKPALSSSSLTARLASSVRVVAFLLAGPSYFSGIPASLIQQPAKLLFLPAIQVCSQAL